MMKRRTSSTAIALAGLFAGTVAVQAAAPQVAAAQANPAKTDPAQSPATQNGEPKPRTGKALAPLAAAAVRPSPIHVLPTDDPDQGLEQQEALTVPAESTLNAQYASLAAAPPVLQHAAASAEAAPEASPPAPSGPSVAIARRIIDAAGAFDHYMRQAAAIHADFNGADAVSQALEAGGAYEQTQIEQGAIAYGALAALQEPQFVATLSQLSPDPAARLAVARQLVAEPEAVMQAPGARRAAARAAGAIGQMGGSLFASGAAVKQAAYDVQHQAWSRSAILAPQVELARIKSQSAARFTLKSDDTAALMRALVALRSSGESAVLPDGPTPPMVARSLALAALAVLGQADEAHADDISPLLMEAKTADCVKMARLNLYQCLSVAGPQYEDVFCLGQHAMMDTAQCVVSGSGYAAPIAPGSVAVPVAVPETPPAVMVPIALAAAPGQ